MEKKAANGDEGLPCMVCFFEGKHRARDLQEVQKILRYKASIAEELLFEGYSSTARLQSRFTEWLFSLTYDGKRAPHAPDQVRLARLLRVSDLLSGALEPLANVLYTMSGTKAEALTTLEFARTLDAFAHATHWSICVKEGVDQLRTDTTWVVDSDARWGVIELSNMASRTGSYVLAVQERVLYLDSALSDAFAMLLEEVAEVASKAEDPAVPSAFHADWAGGRPNVNDEPDES